MNATKRYKDIEFPFICPINNRIFNSGKGLSVYITKTLKMDHSLYYDKYINHRNNYCFFCGNKGKFISVSKGYRNLCEDEVCIKKSFSSHSIEGFMYRNMCTREEAEVLFDLENKRQLKERMKTFDKLRNENPNYDKERCVNSEYFWLKKGYSEEESKKISKQNIENFITKSANTIRNNPEKYASKFPTKIEYYTSKGFSEEYAIAEISKIQNRFSLDGCIEKYGKKEGTYIWEERQKKWLNKLNSKTEEEKIEINKKKIDHTSGFSPISQKLFWDIYNLLPNEKVKFKELNKEFFILSDEKKWYAYDYVDIGNKKVIEFNGDFWHCKPDLYESSYIHRVKKISAMDIWISDEKKIETIKRKGYDVLIIWESEYRKTPKETLNKCIKFLNK